MNYEDWIATVPKDFTGDSLWKMTVYRLALFLSDISWQDVTKLAQDRRTESLSNQLYRSLCSIGANLAEGYSYSTGGNRARYFEYALGSARESREWYFRGRHILGDPVVEHRLSYLTRIVQMLIVAMPLQRKVSLREEREPYETESIGPEVFEDIPMPD